VLFGAALVGSRVRTCVARLRGEDEKHPEEWSEIQAITFRWLSPLTGS